MAVREHGRGDVSAVLVVAVTAVVVALGPAVDVQAAPASGLAPAATTGTATLGPLEAVPGMQSGLPTGAFGVAVLGVLGSDLYLFGSEGETTGNIAGIWRYQSGVWTKIGGKAFADYNRMAPYGAVAYQGSLYVGDRRGGNLYKLVLNADGSFQDLVVAGQAGHEDVFPGPIWNGRLALGTFGAYSTGENAGVYTYDGAAITKVLDLSALGNAAYVTSMVVFGQDLWVTGINSSATLSQVWKIDPSLRATLKYSSPEDYRLVTQGKVLYAVRTTWAYPVETHAMTKWSGSRFVPVSGEIGPFGMIGSLGAINLGGTLFDLCYYNGIYAFDGTALKPAVPGMPTMGAPMSVKQHAGYLWIASNQPVGLYRTPIT